MAAEPHQIPTAHVTKDHEEGHQHDHHTMSEFLEKKEEQKPTDELSVNDFVKDHVSKSEEMKEQQEHNPSFADDHNLDRSTNIDTTGDVTKPAETEEKKGFMEKIKEKLPGGNKKTTTDEGVAVAPAVEHHHPTETNIHQGDYAGEEKKGFMEKIKEKLPGHHKNVEEGKGAN